MVSSMKAVTDLEKKTYLEGLQGLGIALKHPANGGFLLPLGDSIHGLEDLDGRGNA